MAAPRDLELARQLREAREAAGLTQAQIAVRIGVGRTAVSKMEAGKRSPRAQAVRRWMEACGLVLGFVDPGGPDRAAALAEALAAVPEQQADDLLMLLRAWPRLSEAKRQRILGLAEA